MAVLKLAAMSLLLGMQASVADQWRNVAKAEIAQLNDDDLRRHAGDGSYLEGIDVSERRFSENGFDWHLIRFASSIKSDGPLWMVPHDDENPAFEAAITAVKEHGGVAIMVNSGPGSARRQAGYGTCGVRPEQTKSCDPNRNFDARTPKFTAAFLDQRPEGQPVIALHTNSHGFTGDGKGGRGEITILDAKAWQRGQTKARAGGYFAVDPKPEMANYDTLGLTAYLARNGGPDGQVVLCQIAMTKSGTHFWHERVERSDGSMSNYLALRHPDIAYFNAESRDEVDLALSAARHKVMIDAYLKGCKRPSVKATP
jgi:hypothetical protein